MTTVVWMPFRGDGGWRDASFDVAYRQAASLGFDVVVCDSGDEPFSIARTWNLCAERSPDGWERAVLWGADFALVDPATVHDALADGGDWVFAFDACSTLNGRQTRQVHEHGPGWFPPGRIPFGGVRTISRRLWDTAGGYDRRFVGWGHEDRAFAHVAELLVGPRRRVPGHMLNLWHPKRKQCSDAPYFARQKVNHALMRRYQEIVDPDEMRDFLTHRRF